MIHKHWVCSLVFIFVLAGHVKAQLSIADFLRSVHNDANIKGLEEQVAYLQGNPHRLSILRRLEFRMQNQEFLENRQEYALRLNPGNPWEISRNNQYFSNYKSLLSLQKELAFKEALTERYYEVINYLFLAESRMLMQESQKLMNTQLSILERQSGTSFFDADEYVKLRIDVMTKSVELEELEYEVSNQLHVIERLYPQVHNKTLAWDFNSVISIARIVNVTDSLAEASAASIFLAYQRQKITLAKSSYLLEKSNINIGFVQTEYVERRVAEDRVPFNVSLGVTIPLANPNKSTMARRNLSVIEATYELEDEVQDEKRDKIMLEDKLKSLVQRYQNLEIKLEELRPQNFSRTLSIIKQGDPLIIVQLNENVIKLRTLMLKLKRNIFLTYIEYLAFEDALQQRPLVNFLSAELEPIGE